MTAVSRSPHRGWRARVRHLALRPDSAGALLRTTARNGRRAVRLLLAILRLLTVACARNMRSPSASLALGRAGLAKPNGCRRLHARTLLLLLRLGLTAVSTRASVLTRLLRVARLLSREGGCSVTSTRRGRVRRSGGPGRFAVAWRGRGTGSLSGGEFGGETVRVGCQSLVSVAVRVLKRKMAARRTWSEGGARSRDRATSAATSRACGTLAYSPHDSFSPCKSVLDVPLRE